MHSFRLYKMKLIVTVITARASLISIISGNMQHISAREGDLQFDFSGIWNSTDFNIQALENENDHSAFPSENGPDHDIWYYFVITLVVILKVLFWIVWCHYRCKCYTWDTGYSEDPRWRATGRRIMPPKTDSVVQSDELEPGGQEEVEIHTRTRRTSKEYLTENAEEMAIDIPVSGINMRSIDSASSITNCTGVVINLARSTEDTK